MGPILDAPATNIHILIGNADAPQDVVVGPAGSTYAAALRIGWKMISPFVFQEPTGNVLDMRIEAPPHLNVFLRLGSSGDMFVFCSSSAMGSSVFYVCRWVLETVLMYLLMYGGRRWGHSGSVEASRSPLGTSCEACGSHLTLKIPEASSGWQKR